MCACADVGILCCAWNFEPYSLETCTNVAFIAPYNFTLKTCVDDSDLDEERDASRRSVFGTRHSNHFRNIIFSLGEL